VSLRQKLLFLPLKLPLFSTPKVMVGQMVFRHYLGPRTIRFIPWTVAILIVHLIEIPLLFFTWIWSDLVGFGLPRPACAGRVGRASPRSAIVNGVTSM
jgi:hypothetical protein